MTDVSTTCAVVIFRVKVSCITSVDGSNLCPGEGLPYETDGDARRLA